MICSMYNNLIDLSIKLKNLVNLSQKDEISDIIYKISNNLKHKNQYSTEEYIHLAGPSGSLIKLLEFEACSNQCHLEALKSLHHLTFVQDDIVTQAKNKGCPVYPPEIIASVQRITINILKHQTLSVERFSQIEYLHLIITSLSILYNLVVCAPHEVLGNVIINATHPFAFYKVASIQASEDQVEEADFHIGQQFDERESGSSFRAYTNRNRRKRLRRKKAKPSKSSLATELPLDERTVSVPRGVPPPASDSLNAISLKPQWIRGKEETQQEPLLQPKGREPLRLSSTSSKSEEARYCKSTVATDDKLPTAHIPSRQAKEEPCPESFPKLFENNFDELIKEEKASILEAKVRMCSLYTINAVIDKGGKQNKFGFWPQLMCQSPSLMTCILRDPSSSVKMVGLQVTNTFLTDSQQVLSMAVDDDRAVGSYTTLGRQLGSSLRELHCCLCEALLSERSPSLLVRILKTLELLLENVKYSNLKPGLLTKVVTHVKYFLRYKEAVVRANAFSVMVSFLMVKPQLPEMRDLLTKYGGPSPWGFFQPPKVRPPSPCEEAIPEDGELQSEGEDPSEDSFSSDSCAEEGHREKSMVSWIVQRCLDSLLMHKGDISRAGIFIQVQLQSLKVLSALVSEHMSLVQTCLPLIQRVISACCDLKSLKRSQQLWNDPPDMQEEERGVLPYTCIDNEVVVEHAFLLLGSLLGSIKAHLEKGEGRGMSLNDDVYHVALTTQEAVDLWLWALQDPLRVVVSLSEGRLRQKEEHVIGGERDDHTPLDYPMKPLVAAFNVFSHLSSQVLERVGETVLNRVLCVIRFLLWNDQSQLRLAGVRIMAIIAAYPPVAGSAHGPPLALFTVNVTTQLLASRDANVNKDRLLAAWATANIFSTLHVYRETACSFGQHDFGSKKWMMGSIHALIGGCGDKDKIKPHAVRALGYALANLSHDLVCDDEVSREVETAVQTLLDCCSTGSNMRMRWNACNALGNILSSDNLSIQKTTWKSPVLLQLCSLVERFSNYKVRIQACSALCNVRTREVFGAQFPVVWRALLKGLEDAQNIVDYYEIQHRDEFITQLCVSLCHLVLLLRLEDIEDLLESILLHQDTAKSTLLKIHETIPPEQSSCILKAAEKLKLLSDSDALTAPQNQCLNALLDVFRDFL